MPAATLILLESNEGHGYGHSRMVHTFCMVYCTLWNIKGVQII